ncbi:MAG: DNA-binding protein [Proteobacteria bacterium]|nr:DNA-binding protein [Pseudomonadota bacterium]
MSTNAKETATITREKRAFSDKEAADYIGMSESYLRISRMDGDRANRTPGPNFIKIGKAVRYLKEDLDAWLESHRVTKGKTASGKN